MMVASKRATRQLSRIRADGARIGAYPGLALSVLFALAGVSFEATSLAVWIAPMAIPVGVVLGWWHAPQVVPLPRWPVGRLLLMGLEAMSLGLLLMSFLGGIGMVLESPTLNGAAAFTFGAASVAFWGLLILGLPMFLMATTAAFAWAALLRRRYPPDPLP